jgi:uncharacterized coiled-coil protein SlyX
VRQHSLSLSGDNEDLSNQLTTAQRENRRLAKHIRHLDSEIADLQGLATEAERAEMLTAQAQNQDSVIRKLRGVIASQKEAIEIFEQRQNPEIETLVSRVETALKALAGGHVSYRYAETLTDRLLWILDQVQQIRPSLSEGRDTTPPWSPTSSHRGGDHRSPH